MQHKERVEYGQEGGIGKIGVWSGWRGKGPTVKTNYRPLYT